jgi:putative toxin-antitoxin system antitoxin component (TIGR02293 family)
MRRKSISADPAVRVATLGIAVDNVVEVGTLIKAGFRYEALARFHSVSRLPLDVIIHAVRIPPRTLARRKAAGRLSRDESERLLRLAGVFESAVRLFEGDVDAARTWLQAPARAFGGKTPLAVAETEIGAREVEDLVGRLEHGVFS